MTRKVSKVRRAKLGEPAPRTYHVENTVLHVKNGYHAVPCDGVAHGNAYIDHCMDCLEHTWGWIAVKNEEK